MKFYIKKLGCPKNDVDGDYIAAHLIEKGHEIVFNDTDAETVIVNTCGFILPAKEESINEVLYYEKLKKEGKIKRLYVTGCLSQRYSRELADDIKDVDGFFGLGQINELINSVSGRKTAVPLVSVRKTEELSFLGSDKRFINSRYPYEYLKIADGCSRYCAYCAIPHIRGRYRSRSPEEIIGEAESLAAAGKKELILVSQESSRYGHDFPDKTGIIELLRKLEKINGIRWVRVMYLHPESLSDELIEYMTTSEKVLGYFDIPLQHISDKILRLMNRPVSRMKIEKKLEKIRESSSENVIRTTFIAGFPGETDKEFDELHDFIEDFKFDRLGVFQYSPEEETVAMDMPDQVPEYIAAERQDLLMSLQQEIAFNKNIALIDKIQEVIIDEIEPGSPARARTGNDCPEIDQTVYVKGGRPRVGDFMDVKIIMAEGYDLVARAGDSKNDKV